MDGTTLARTHSHNINNDDGERRQAFRALHNFLRRATEKTCRSAEHQECSEMTLYVIHCRCYGSVPISLALYYAHSL
ncbi:unnamed protein product, partial [Pylaiella littoralis]